MLLRTGGCWSDPEICKLFPEGGNGFKLFEPLLMLPIISIPDVLAPCDMLLAR